MTWNPDAPGVLGLQAPFVVESAYAVDSPSKAAGAAVLSHSAETIDKASMYAAAVAGTAGYVMEVWPLLTAEAPEPSTSTFRPNEDVVATNLKIQTGAAATVSTSYPTIDEPTLAISDYLKTDVGAGPVGEWAGRVNVGTGNLTGKQILRVEVHYVAKNSAGVTSSFYAYLNIGGVQYIAPNDHVTETQEEKVAVWEYNPATGLPWTIADLELFDVSDEIGFYTYALSTAQPVFVYQGWVEVDHVPEQRLAVGAATITAVGYQEFNLSTPTGGTTWAKANATEYLLTVRRLYGTGSASFRYLDSLADAPNEHHGYAVQFSGADGRLLEMGAEYTRVHSLIITTSAPATSADSQPYALRSLAAIYTGHTAEQEFTGAAANYGVVKAVIAAQAGVPTASLLVKIKRRSDNVQHGTTMTFAPEELTGTPTALREITVMMSAAALTAVQEYVEFSTTAPNGQGWVVVLLDTTGTGSSATFGGTTDAATVGGVQDNDTDLAVVVAQIPTAPTNLVVATVTAANGHEYNRITWTKTSLGASFLRYELQRNDDADPHPVLGWQTIGKFLSETVEEFDDYESRRGVEASYRLRVVHTNGVASNWTAVATGTAG